MFVSSSGKGFGASSLRGRHSGRWRTIRCGMVLSDPGRTVQLQGSRVSDYGIRTGLPRNDAIDGFGQHLLGYGAKK